MTVVLDEVRQESVKLVTIMTMIDNVTIKLVMPGCDSDTVRNLYVTENKWCTQAV